MSIFTKVRGLRPKRHLHNLSHDNLISHDMGQIVPCFVMHHCIPSSNVSISYSQLSRMQALIAPIMSTVDSYIRFFKVPYRLIDYEWTRFISGEAEVNEFFVYDPPYITFSSIVSNLESGELLSTFFGAGSLMEFLGYPLPFGADSSYYIKLSIRPLQAYLLVIKSWYFNENISSDVFTDLLAEIDFLVPDPYQAGIVASPPTGDVSKSVVDLLRNLKKVSSSMCFPHAWGKDYFTSALPFVQVGEPVRLSMVDSAPVSISSQDITLKGKSSDGDEILAEFSSLTTPHDPTFIGFGTTPYSFKDGIVWGNAELQTDPEPPYSPTGVRLSTPQGALKRLKGEISSLQGTADLSDATAISILEFRIANALQSYKELTARIGHRYNEYLKGTFNVNSRDARLQLPERLGGGKVPVNISDIEQTSATAANQTAATGKTPLGWLAGKATAFGGYMKPIKTFIDEDCLIIGVLYTQPKSRNYCNQGINRFFTKLTDRFDFFHPKFEHIGEQAIKTTELYASAGADDVFGYAPRYAEYKWWANEVHGQFNTTLDFWHFARKFSSKPTLSPEFIYVQQSEMTRPFAVQEIEGKSLQQCMTWLHFNVDYLAPMSKYGTPMLLN